MSDKQITLTYMRKDYIFSKDPHEQGILIEIDGVKVLLSNELIARLMRDE